MNIILFDPSKNSHFYPITLTRPAAFIRWGALTIFEKWQQSYKDAVVSTLSMDYLMAKFPCSFEQENLYINALCVPTTSLKDALNQLKINEALLHDGEMIALKSQKTLTLEELLSISNFEKRNIDKLLKLNNLWEIFTLCGEQLNFDLQLIKSKFTNNDNELKNRGNTIIGQNLHIGANAKVSASIINTDSGAVIIDEGAEVMEGSIIRGPLYLGKGAQLKMGTKIYGPTIIGPFCKVGGEVSNSVFFAFSNKGHDGFLGNSVIGEWCNLGADTNTSNLKNNYSEVKLYNYNAGKFVATNQQFIGSIIGDHSKTGINTMLNTGTVVGIHANIFGADFPPKFIPSFSWGGASGFETFKKEKAKEVAQKMMHRRGVVFEKRDKDIIDYLFDTLPEVEK